MHITHSHKPESTPKLETQYGQLQGRKNLQITEAIPKLMAVSHPISELVCYLKES